MATSRPIRTTLPAALVACLVTACSSLPGQRPDRPEASIGGSWLSQRNRDHALAGRIWDVRAGKFVDEEALRAVAQGARLLLLGEVHDNADHHLLQARLVRMVTATGRRPAIAFEMIDETRQAAIESIPEGERSNPEAYREAVRWDGSGWPDFALYRPVFEAALEARLPVIAANLPRARVREASRKGLGALPAAVRKRIERQGPLPPDVLAEFREEMSESHCGELPESMLDPLVLGQRARDAQLAQAIAEGSTADGAILITGSGHARLDRGVASYLAGEELAQGPVVAISFQEVTEDRREPADYQSARAEPVRFDFVVFTPGAEREDPCEGLREHLRRMERHPPLPEGARDEGTPL